MFDAGSMKILMSNSNKHNHYLARAPNSFDGFLNSTKRVAISPCCEVKLFGGKVAVKVPNISSTDVCVRFCRIISLLS